MKAKMGRMARVMAILVTTTSTISPGLLFNAWADTPSSRPHRAISSRLHIKLPTPSATQRRSALPAMGHSTSAGLKTETPYYMGVGTPSLMRGESQMVGELCFYSCKN